MNKRLFVGGLPFSLNSQGLNDLFAKVGTVVSADVIMDKFTGQSKGFGFVEMSSDEEAQKAIETLNNTEVEGRKIVVNEARPREERSGGDFRSGGPRRDFGGGRDNNRGGGRSFNKRW